MKKETDISTDSKYKEEISKYNLDYSNELYYFALNIVKSGEIEEMLSGNPKLIIRVVKE